MNTPIDDGGTAFPAGPGGDSMHGEDGRVWHQYPATPGMSLRAWFAGQALAGLLANGNWGSTQAVKFAIKAADEMISALKGGRS